MLANRILEARNGNVYLHTSALLIFCTVTSFTSTAAYRIAAWLAQDELHVSGGMLRPPGRLAKVKLAVAQKLLSRVISDIPRSWTSWWIAGKIHQRLQEYALALECFERGLAIQPTQPDLAIEASLAAVYLGLGVKAEKYAQIAVAARPDDASHGADLALALLVVGKPLAARLAAEEALKLAPNDNVTQTLHRLCNVIIEKALPCPKDMAGLQKLANREGISDVLTVPPTSPA